MTAPHPVLPSPPVDLHASLRPYRAHAVLSAVAEGGGVLLAGWGAAAALAATLGAAPEPSRVINAVVVTLVLGGVAAAAGHALRRLWRGPAAARRLAQQVEQCLPELHDGVRGAVGLLHGGGTPEGASSALLRAHVLAVADQLRAPGAHGRFRQGLLRRARPLLAAGTAGLLLGLAVMTLAPQRLALGWHRALDRAAPGAAGRDAALPPLWSDVSMTLVYPAYMHRESRTLDGVSGDLSAPRGTEVVLHARADRAVAAARLLFSRGDVPLKLTPPRDLSGTFTVQEGGRYRLALTDSHGEEVVEGDGHAITLEADNPPVVEMLAPTEDRTVGMDERLPLSFKARDDFGLTEVSLVIRNLRKGGDPVRKPLARITGEPAEQSGGGSLEIATLDARAGDRLVLTIEAKDNDTVSGPKAGVSANRTLKIFSAAEHHAELLVRQEEVEQKMVAQLADELETPLQVPADHAGAAPEQEAERWASQVKRGQTLVEELNALAQELAKDRLAPAEVPRALRNMQADLGRSYDEMAGLATEIRAQVRETLRFPEPYAQRSVKLGKAVTEKLRQHILYLDDLMGRQRLAEAQDLARELAATQARLRDLLAQYAKAGDEETRKKIMEEIASMRQQLAQLSEQMARLQRDIPQEYVNTEALDQKNLQDPLEQLDKMLKEGDMQAAADALEKMAQNTRSLLDQMQKGQQEYGGEQYAELREKLSNLKDELDDVTKEQERLLGENKQRMEDVRERARKEMGADLEQLTQRMLAQAEEIKKSLDTAPGNGLSEVETEHLDEVRSRADEAVRGLKAKDFEETQKSVRQALGALEWLRSLLVDRTEGRFASQSPGPRKTRERVESTIPKAQKLLEQLERLMPNPAEKMTSGERDAVRESSRRQGKLAERARQLGQDMDAIGKEVPLFGQEHKDGLDGARRSMQGAQASLGSRDLPGASDRQREALGKLQELQRSLNEMGKSGGQGMPLPFGSPNDGTGGDGNGSMANKEKVEIPGADMFQVPPQFRKDILDAMKEQPPSKFQGGVKQYYEELVK